jgi:D-alanyl-D-alanine carboxypeptidase (penicillin-binding protein 5/6)
LRVNRGPIHAAAIAVSLFAFAAGSGALAAVPTVNQAPITMMVDLTTGQILQERSVDRRFLPASITKVMTIFTAFELMEKGALSPTQSFTIRPETHAEWFRKGSTMFLPADEPVTVDNLLRGITTVSANDGSVVLAESAAGSVDRWTAMMNAKAREIGMADSHFGTPNGWPDDGKTFVSARDLITLAGAMISRHPQKYETYFGHEGFRYGGVAQANHDPLVGRVEGADGIKTGFTTEAGYGFLGSAKRGDRRLVMVVAGAPSEDVRDEAARRFIEWGFSSFASRKVYSAGSLIGSAKVQNGSERSVSLIASKPVRISMPTGTAPKMAMKVRYRGPIRAPIEAGQEIAQLEVAVEGMPTSYLPLVADKSIDKAGPLQRIYNGFLSWVS